MGRSPGPGVAKKKLNCPATFTEFAIQSNGDTPMRAHKPMRATPGGRGGAICADPGRFEVFHIDRIEAFGRREGLPLPGRLQGGPIPRRRKVPPQRFRRIPRSCARISLRVLPLPPRENEWNRKRERQREQEAVFASGCSTVPLQSKAIGNCLIPVDPHPHLDALEDGVARSSPRGQRAKRSSDRRWPRTCHTQRLRWPQPRGP